MEKQVLNKLPEDFVPRQQWPEYDLVATSLPFMNLELVGNNPKGVRWGLWPLYFEEYVSDKEPDLLLSNSTGATHNRIVLWRRYVRRDIPKGWREFSRPSRLEGFAEITGAEYWRAWSKSARQYRKKWLEEYKDKKYKIEKVPYDEFAKAYLSGVMVRKAGHLALGTTKRVQDAAGNGTVAECWGARYLKDGVLMAGMAVINSPTCSGSYYLCSFYQEKASGDPLMLGLMDNWFRVCRERNIRFLHFGRFWQKGDPKNWRGFSLFKSKFDISYLSHPPPLMRIARGRFF